MKVSQWLLVLFAAAALALAGCAGGDDGDQGPPGATGPQGPGPASFNATSLNWEITSASVPADGMPVATVEVTDQDGLPVTGISSINGFTIVKLVPASSGNASYWQSYIIDEESYDGGTAGDGTARTTVQAGRESDGTWTELGEGKYQYKFATNIKSVTTPTAVSYEPSRTHRVALQYRNVALDNGETVSGDAVYDFVPAGGAVTATRDIVDTATCNECHTKLEFHGGPRQQVEYCVTCHNPGSTDANSNNTVDMKVMIHKIHNAANLPSVVDGGTYTIWGHNDSEHDYSEVVFPLMMPEKDISAAMPMATASHDVAGFPRCERCHTGSGADVDNWKTAPTIEACTSCHDLVKFDGSGDGVATFNHTAGQRTNAECATCHGVGTSNAVETVHDWPSTVDTEVARYEYRIDSANWNVGGGFVNVRFTILKDGAAMDINADSEWIDGTGASRLALAASWPAKEITNDGTSNPPAEPEEVDLLAAGLTQNGDGSYNAAIALPGATAAGSGIVHLEGHPAVTLDGALHELPVANDVMAFAITDATATERREVVSVAKCNVCHGNLALHGNNRSGNAQVCANCHNQDMTDAPARLLTNPAVPIFTSPLDPDENGFVDGGFTLTDTNSDGFADTVSGTGAPADGLVEESIDYKRMIHRIHAGNVIIYGFTRSAHDYTDVTFSGHLNACEECHDSGTYGLPLESEVLATTINTASVTQGTGAISLDGASSNDRNITRTAAVCSSCHDSSTAQAHMEQNGGAFDITDANIGLTSATTETCATCHGSGGVADVEEVHAQ